MPGLASWQCMPSTSVPDPVHGPRPSHCFCVASSTHLPLTGHAASLVHQQHWICPPQPPWFISHVVFAGPPWLPPRLHVGPTIEQPAESVFWPPVQAVPEHFPLWQPPLLTTFRPLLLHCALLVQRQYWCFESRTGAGDGRVVVQVYVEAHDPDWHFPPLVVQSEHVAPPAPHIPSSVPA